MPSTSSLLKIFSPLCNLFLGEGQIVVPKIADPNSLFCIKKLKSQMSPLLSLFQAVTQYSGIKNLSTFQNSNVLKHVILIWNLNQRPTVNFFRGQSAKLKINLLQNRQRITDLENKLMVAGGKDSQGLWEGHVHTIIFTIDNEQGSSVQH